MGTIWILEDEMKVRLYRAAAKGRNPRIIRHKSGGNGLHLKKLLGSEEEVGGTTITIGGVKRWSAV